MLGALVNAVLLVAFSCSILVTSIQRLLVLKEIENPKLILTVGVIGICIHLVGLVLFYERSDGMWILCVNISSLLLYRVHLQHKFLPRCSTERRKEMFYLTMHSTHFIYSYMASGIW